MFLRALVPLPIRFILLLTVIAALLIPIALLLLLFLLWLFFLLRSWGCRGGFFFFGRLGRALVTAVLVYLFFGITCQVRNRLLSFLRRFIIALLENFIVTS